MSCFLSRCNYRACFVFSPSCCMHNLRSKLNYRTRVCGFPIVTTHFPLVFYPVFQTTTKCVRKSHSRFPLYHSVAKAQPRLSSHHWGENRFHAAIANEGNSLNFNAIELSSPNLSQEEELSCEEPVPLSLLYN